MKRIVASCCLALSLLNSALAEQRPPISLRVINLGSQPIIAFTLVGLPFRDVGLDIRPGEVLTPMFSDHAMGYEVYWRFRDGSIHAAALDLRALLPASFYGEAFISLHDSGAALTWSNWDPAWVEFRRSNPPWKEGAPQLPLYESCAGPLLHDAVALKAWRESAERIRKRLEANPRLSETQRAECDLERYVPYEPGRVRVEPEEAEAKRLRQEWLAEIEKLQGAH